MYLFGTIIALTAAVIIGFQNCSSSEYQSVKNGQAPTGSDADLKSIQDLYTLIRSLSAEDLHCVQDADCTMVGLGAKPCGGPHEYVVASELSANHSRIDGLAKDLADYERQYNNDNELSSTCDVQVAPRPACFQGTCKADTDPVPPL